MSERGSHAIFLRTLFQTGRISVRVIAEGALGIVDRQTCDHRLRRWARKAIRMAEAKVVVEGLHRFDPNETFVVMSNHQSNYDILAIYYAYPGCLRMVAKQEMKSIPLVGKGMEASEFIFIDRQNRGSAIAALDGAKEQIRSGISVWIAPEGTRSEDGELIPFKKGGFMLALSAGVRILPCTVVGTRDVMPTKSLGIHKGKDIRVTFHDPIDAASYGIERRDALMEDVRNTIDGGLRAGG